jgi:transcriptional regulator with XRE-family HTH domain
LPRRRKPLAPVNEELIGRRLRELRNQQGLTQVEIAEKLGLNQSLVSQYERGEVRLHGTLLAALATVLKCSSDQILGLERIEENGLLRDRRFLRRIQKIDQLSKRRKQALLKSLDMLLKGAAVG